MTEYTPFKYHYTPDTQPRLLTFTPEDDFIFIENILLYWLSYFYAHVYGVCVFALIAHGWIHLFNLSHQEPSTISRLMFTFLSTCLGKY